VIESGGSTHPRKGWSLDGVQVGQVSVEAKATASAGRYPLKSAPKL
jgi:hypothetical protein